MPEPRRTSTGRFYEGKTARLEKKVPQLVRHADDQSEVTSAGRRHVRIDVPAREMPIPAVARATLVAFGWPDRGRSEKVAWQVRFEFEGHPFVLEDQKLGVNLHMWVPAEWDHGAEIALADRALATIRRAISVAETDIFRPAIKAQVGQGQLILINNLRGLKGSYRYLRQLAEAKSEAGAPPLPTATDVGEQILNSFNQRSRRAGERQTLTDAMIVAFYAYLERYLTLALPFSQANLDVIDLAKFLASTWGEKFKTVVDLTSPETKKLYDELLHVAETFRNPRAHGHDKRGSTMGVYLNGVGAIPVMVTGIESSPFFSLEAYSDESFTDITRLFDEIDDLVRGPALGNAAHWILSGFDVRFFADDVKHYRLPADEYMAFYTRESEAWEREVNMDWW
jgi:hypothetical protein